MSHCTINITIFWKCLTRPFRCNNLRTMTQEENIETRQMTSFFSSTFSALTLHKIHFWIWKYLKFILKWSPLWYILILKIPQFFGGNLLIRTAHHNFLVSRHPEVTKNLYYVLSTHQRQIPSFLGCSLWAIDFVLILFPCLLHFANTFEVSMNWNSQVCCHCPFFNSVVILRCTNYFSFWNLDS